MSDSTEDKIRKLARECAKQDYSSNPQPHEKEGVTGFGPGEVLTESMEKLNEQFPNRTPNQSSLFSEEYREEWKRLAGVDL